MVSLKIRRLAGLGPHGGAVRQVRIIVFEDRGELGIFYDIRRLKFKMRKNSRIALCKVKNTPPSRHVIIELKVL